MTDEDRFVDPDDPTHSADSADPGGYQPPPPFAPPGQYGPLSPYGQPHYGPPPYGGQAPQYSQPPYYVSPYPGATPYPMPEQRNRRALLVVAICLVSVLALVGVAVVAWNASSDGHRHTAGPVHTLSLPANSGQYNQMTGNVAARYIDSARQMMGTTAGPHFQSAKIGLYALGSNSRPNLVFFGWSAADDQAVADELRRNAPSNEVDQVFLGAGVSNADDYPAGPFGGALRCGNATVQATTVPLCVWADGSTLGMLLLPNLTVDAAATVTLAFRGDAEH